MENEPKKKKVLLIEDDVFISQMYALKFKQSPFELLLAKSEEEGFAIIQEQRPDLILLDIILPKTDGFMVLEHLKKDPSTKDIPIIFLTNLGQQENIQRGMNLGAIDYIIKAHYTPQEVVSKVVGYLS